MFYDTQKNKWRIKIGQMYFTRASSFLWEFKHIGSTQKWLLQFQRGIQDRRTRRAPLFGNIFVHFDCKTLIYFNFSQHAICTIWINSKSIGYVLRGIKTIPRPQELYCAGSAPPVLKEQGTLGIKNGPVTWQHFT